MLQLLCSSQYFRRHKEQQALEQYVWKIVFSDIQIGAKRAGSMVRKVNKLEWYSLQYSGRNTFLGHYTNRGPMGLENCSTQTASSVFLISVFISQMHLHTLTFPAIGQCNLDHWLGSPCNGTFYITFSETAPFPSCSKGIIVCLFLPALFGERCIFSLQGCIFAIRYFSECIYLWL